MFIFDINIKNKWEDSVQIGRLKRRIFMKLTFNTYKFLYSLTLIMLATLVQQLFVFATQIDEDQFKQDFKEKYKTYAFNIPGDLNFAGENVPLDNFNVYQKMDRALLANSYWRTQSNEMHQRASRWFPLIESILAKHNIPSDFKYLPAIESSFLNATSHSGAVGFWQLMDKTAVEYGLSVNDEVDERNHIEKSTKAACKYLKKLKRELGSWTLVALAYNMGVNATKDQIARQHTRNYYDLKLNREAARYVYRLLAMKEVIEHPENYGYRIAKKATIVSNDALALK